MTDTPEQIIHRGLKTLKALQAVKSDPDVMHALGWAIVKIGAWSFLCGALFGFYLKWLAA